MSVSSLHLKVLIIVPAYNEAEQIKAVIEDIRVHAPYADIAVVNDGSADDTLQQALLTGATVLNLPYNLGIGGAVQTGYLHAMNEDYDIAVQIDGDGQHDPADLRQLLSDLVDNGADMAIGSRFLDKAGYQSTWMRKIGISFLSNLVSGLTGHRATDTTSGFRVCGRRAISLFAHWYPTDYPEVESLILLNNHGLRFIETPVTMRSRAFGKSSITAIKSMYYMVKVTLAILLSHSWKPGQEQSL
ncbi:glycosyltransferase family 2 protein [Paenibacillus sp. J5C_2022]|uniref:glycosyltransferase family 2 protein n=1 Tax=Paenibacillus sp. J5C2022 TaxID=2977129 RepID=UPI0021CE4864|nr:glycosyltransferase family 2 protein [Paenibacillus sp. J5C2022]MCU6709059.1 glycosyltransferase family 2 protein [Paenibacillus sp. J5C2022]